MRLEELGRLCEAKSSGLALIRANKVAQVFLKNGAIVSLTCAGKSGQAAVAELTELTEGKINFFENMHPTHENPLTDTRGVLNTLLNSVGQARPAQPKAAAAAAGALAPAQKTFIEEALLEQIGPMAYVVLDTHLQSYKDLDSLLQAIVAEIPDADKAAAFLAEVKRHIK